VTGYRVVRDRPPTLAALVVGLVVGVLASLLVAAVWPNPAPRAVRIICQAEGGVLVITESGPVCLWAGAVIPVRPRP